ncbi:hypothetical protein P8A22_00020 [Streptomyces laculatispora]|uniref:Uncharacterized protein n=1 Tax=Streptomyces laculatispora TaxID=887464 RepID=A0ABY9HVJ3_9ACTN|nr:hypothetical protein [Streptomyces laculatispora]WLQ38588.1 hypothetical protein P8A22_00020 [Streptomyces laculatispora]
MPAPAGPEVLLVHGLDGGAERVHHGPLDGGVASTEDVPRHVHQTEGQQDRLLAVRSAPEEAGALQDDGVRLLGGGARRDSGTSLDQFSHDQGNAGRAAAVPVGAELP